MSSQLGETHELPSDQGDYELNGKGEKRERGRGNEGTSEEELSIKPRNRGGERIRDRSIQRTTTPLFLSFVVTQRKSENSNEERERETKEKWREKMVMVACSNKSLAKEKQEK